MWWILRWIVTVVCALGFAACLAAWVRSYWVLDEFYVYHDSPASSAEELQRHLTSDSGSLRFLQVREIWLRPEFIAAKDVIRFTYGHEGSKIIAPRAAFFGLTRFAIDRSKSTLAEARDTYYLSFRIPHWFPTAIFGSLAAIGIVRIRRDRQRRSDPIKCKSCGYDLRSGHEKCPECGAASHVPAASVAKSEPL